ncbi:CoA transferase subunit A [Streptomyces yaanensis]|uniref:CoA transferase subunit A n=1 Tax=Streptomyces yaanensis TaxID=1142239 RepID=A0ABV7SJD4_9ACTN|nr:CoA-transferase [Streptomyces sp. CGMCC 4.7035]WNC01259.1 CoA-transferase [Streptomyces sp. CGMCC 4.7035]
MRDKTMTADEVVSRLESGMTLGIGGWGSRRKPMALVRALLRSGITDLTVVSYGGPDVGMLAAAGRIRRLVAAFATLDSIPLEPHFRAARESGAFELVEVDEAMFMWGLRAGANRLPFLPVRAGIGSDVMRVNPGLRTVTSPYADGWPFTGGDGSPAPGPHAGSAGAERAAERDETAGTGGGGPGVREEFVAMPALRMDAALVHVNRADRAGNGQYLGPDPYFDDLFCEAADAAYVSCERIVDTAELTKEAAPQTLLIKRHTVTGVVEAPNGAHFTSCAPDHERDEAFQRHYATTAWPRFAERFLAGDEHAYQSAVRAWHKERS